MIRSVFQTFILCLLFFVAEPATASSFTVNERILESSKRVSRIQTDFVYFVSITNNDGNVSSVSVSVESTGSHTVIIDGSLTFGAIENGSQATSSDTFTLRQNRRFPFNPDSLVFTFTGIPETSNTKPVANVGNNQTVALNSEVTLDGTASSDQDGDSLFFQWTFLERPEGSTAELLNPDLSQPSFTLDKAGQYKIQLIVNDGQSNSIPQQMIVSTVNSAPEAEAGTPQTVIAGDTVMLDGSGSLDVDGDALTYIWSFLNRPENSIATLTDATIVKPQFVIDILGAYELQLIVNDGIQDSQPDSITISTQNSVPVANAGIDFTVLLNENAVLDGTASSDVDGNTLTYNWTILSRPDGSTTSLSETTDPKPSLLIDVPGSYEIQLIVNDGFADSETDTILITSENSRPLADAGEDKTVFVTDRVQLNGFNSSDADLDVLSYRWSISSKPNNSSAVLATPVAEQTTVTIDYPGTYVIQLIVNDGTIDSLADTVVITTQNSRPVANAGEDTAINVGSKLVLNGESSIDVDFDSLDYQWSVTFKPDNSTPILTNETLVKSEFVADNPGSYILQLIVFDGSLPSVPDTLVIEAIPPTVEMQVSKTSGSVPLDVTLNAIPHGGFSPYQFEWDLDGNGTTDDTRKNFVHSFLQRGNQNVTLKMTDAAGYEATATQLITINSAPLVIVSATPSTGSAPLSVNFSATVSDADGEIKRFDWDFDGDGIVDQSSPSSASATHFYQNAGLYNAKLTVYDNDGLSNSDIVTISVGSAPEVIASADVFAGIAPLSVTFSGTVTDSDGQVVLYEWDFDGDKQFDYSSPTSADITHSYTEGGVFNATLRVSDNDGLIDEDSLIISVSGPPTSLPGAYPLSGEAPLTVTFFSDGKDLDGGPEYYDWDFDGNGSFDRRLIASQNTTYTYDQPGVYQASLQVVDDDGLTATASITITVEETTGNSISGVPTAKVSATPSNGPAPLNVLLLGSAIDEDGSITKYEWDFDSDGVYDFSENVNDIKLITETIDVGSYARQAFADFDGDGDLDMVVGNSNGQILYFLNDGNGNVFEYSNQGLLKDGEDNTIDIGSYATPFAYDIDGDNDFDLLVGNSNGWTYVLENTGTTQVPAWVNNGTLKLAGGGNVDVGNFAAPIVYSNDNDNDWDLLIGNRNGVLAVVENTGSNNFPVWVDNGDLQDSTGVLIDIGSYAVPWLVDHTGNGVMDLYVGESNGRIVLLENQGTDQSPVWINQSLLTDEVGTTIDTGSYAAPIIAHTSGTAANDFWIGNSSGHLSWHKSVSATPLVWKLKSSTFNSIDVGSYAEPVLFDYNDNGIWDLVVGNSNGNIQLVRNLGTDDKPVFRPGGLMLDNLGDIIDIGSYASPAFFDLDNDGDEDLILGNSNGRFVYYQNIGTVTSPTWTLVSNVINSAGTSIDIGSYSTPFFYDVDGDGDQDMLSGNSGGQLYIINNIGSANSPVWELGDRIIDENGTIIDVGSNANPLITDINNDGALDILVGNSNGVIFQYENINRAWVLKETKYGQADVGSYAAPVAINIDGDADEDLLVGNSSGLIYQLKSYGNAQHTYASEGTYNATFRGTDNSGNTVTEQIIITALPAGYPSLAINADVKEGLVPLSVKFKALASDNDGSIATYEWDFDGDGVYELTGTATQSHTYTKLGAFNPQVRVTDNDGKQATVSIPLKVNMSVNFSHNAVINPDLNEKSAIGFVLESEATISLKVVDELGNVVKQLVDGELRTAGSYTDSWDGFNSLNNKVADGAYYFVMNYSHNGIQGEIDARSSFVFNQYTPNRTWPSTFNPYTGIPVTSTYTINKPSEVSFYFWVRDRSRTGSSIAPVRTLFIRELKSAGTQTEIWDGVDDNGVPVKPGEQYRITLWVYELPDNAILITGSKPVISDLSVENRIFNSAFNPYSAESTPTTRVQFEVTKDASMEVVVIDSAGLQIDRFNKAGLTAGANSISWDGRNFNDALVPAGVYSLQMTAIDSKGNRSLPRYAIVTVRY